MNSHPATPWIYHQSHLMIAARSPGFVRDDLFFWVKLSGVCVAGPTTGCYDVLNSPDATVLGWPLTVFGCLAYGTMLLLVTVPFVMERDHHPLKRSSS